MSADLRFPGDIWEFDDPGRTATPNLYLNELWGLGIGTDWRIRSTNIPGEPENQLDLVYGNGQQKAVLRLSPDYSGGVQPLETTFTQFLSRTGYYDLYVDTTLNRLADVNKPVFGAMMVATDGQPRPMYFLHSSTNYGATFDRHVEMDPADKIWKFNDMTGMTPEGGFAIKVQNRTGSTSVKGTLVHVSNSFANAVDLVPIGIPDPIGVVYTAGIANGEDIWIVHSGIAEVLFVNASTAGYFARMCMSTDPGAAAGRAFSEALPTSPFATDKHFMEIGHIFETKDAGSLVKTALHFN